MKHKFRILSIPSRVHYRFHDKTAKVKEGITPVYHYFVSREIILTIVLSAIAFNFKFSIASPVSRDL